ncbi:DUF4442 domain-containing protein [Burkholderia pseudomallei]|nr:DUF4442 domain-containing protein [Burkholderia pseudomallei]
MNKLAFNAFILTKVPIAWIAGVRIRHLDNRSCQMEVKCGWLNQNPFKSMFWAVEGMAAEFSTGAICISKIRKSKRQIALLVVNLEANFTKKAVGKIIFSCDQGVDVDAIIENATNTREPQVLRMRSVGIDGQGDQVAEFVFTWSFKANS